MDLTQLLCILAMAVHLILSLVVFFRSPRNPVNRIFSVMLLLFLLWSLGELLLMCKIGGMLAFRLLATPIILLPYLFANFTALFPRRLENSLIIGSTSRKILAWIPAAYLLWLLWSGNLVDYFDLIPSGFLLSFGPYEFHFKGILALYLLISMKDLSMTRKNLTSEFQEKRFRYTLCGLILPASAGSMFVAMGKWYVTSKSVYTFGVFPALGIIMACLIGYAILRYQLMEIDLIFSIGLIYTLLTIVLTGGVEIIQNLLQSYFEVTSFWTTIVSTLAIAAVFAPLKSLISWLVDYFFGRKVLEAPVVLRRILGEMRQGTTHQDVIKRFLKETREVFEFSAAAITFKNGLSAESRETSTTDPPAIEAISVTPNGTGKTRSLPPLPEMMPKIDDIDAILESAKETENSGTPELSQWWELGFRNIFHIPGEKEKEGGLFISPKTGRGPLTSHEKEIIASMCQEIPHIIENVTLLATLIERDRDASELQWAHRLYHRIQADQGRLDFRGREVRFFSSLAKQLKGDLIDVCESGGKCHIAICDAFHHGIQAALTLHIIRSSLRAAAGPENVSILHGILRDYSDPPLRSAVTLIEFETNGKIRVVNAGNIPPVLIGSNPVTCRSLTEFGKPLGLDGAIPAPACEITLTGDQFLICATNGLAKVFGDEKGTGLFYFLDKHKGSTLSGCHGLIQKALEQIPGRLEFPDDITYVLIGPCVANKRTSI